MTLMAGITLYAAAKKKIKSRLHTVLLLCTVFSSIGVWLIEQFHPRGLEFLSVSYILDECLLLAIYRSMQKRNLMSEESRTQSYTINVLLSIYLLLFANFVRVIMMGISSAMYEISHIVVLMIYLGMLVSWGVTRLWSAHRSIVSNAEKVCAEIRLPFYRR